MADVQLEHGHLRIANALDEAITFAAFTGAQHKIVRCLVRLTFGWRRRTVRIALPDLAERCNLAMTGGFRRALEELIREGVVVEVEKPYGRIPALYAINKDFESWGKLSVAARALEALFGGRPANGDSATQLPPQGHATTEDDAGDEPRCLPPQGAMTAPTGHDSRPQGGGQAGAKSLFDETVQPRKDSERHEIQTSSSPWQPGKESDIAAQLTTDAGRNALAAVLHAVSQRGGTKAGVIAEIEACMSGNRGAQHRADAAAIDVALSDYATNGLSSGAWNASHFRACIRRAVAGERPAPPIVARPTAPFRSSRAAVGTPAPPSDPNVAPKWQT